MNRAFSLVELSIVLVILGLLIGGIMAGQSLIRASELRAVSSEYARYLTATHAFRDKYFAIPGDFNNAVNIWGRSSACGGTSDSGTCNGNATGTLSAGAAGGTSEVFQFWNHLALAGLIEGQYSGLAGTSNDWHSMPGTNLPASKLRKAGWAASTTGTLTSVNFFFDGQYGNSFSIGSGDTANLSYPNSLTPPEAWNIDTKMDDGMPGTGKIVMRCLTGYGGCTTGSLSTDTTASYRLNATAMVTGLYFRNAF